MTWSIAIALGLVLAACGESTSGELAAETEPQASTTENEGEPTDGQHPGAAAFQVDQECRNRGSVDGLESSWHVDGFVPDEWRDRENVDGVLRHSQDGWATFTANEGLDAVIEVTDTGIFTGGCAAWAVAGEEAAAVFQVDEECSNGGGVADAFGVGWGSWPNTPPAEWRLLETVEGVMHFESFERSYFEVDGHRHEMTTMATEDSCEGWPSS